MVPLMTSNADSSFVDLGKLKAGVDMELRSLLGGEGWSSGDRMGSSSNSTAPLAPITLLLVSPKLFELFANAELARV